MGTLGLYQCGKKLSTQFDAECQLLFTTYKEEALDQELDDYENLVNAIDTGINFRNTNACMAFGRPCEFYDICWNNKKPEKVDTLVPKQKGKK